MRHAMADNLRVRGSTGPQVRMLSKLRWQLTLGSLIFVGQTAGADEIHVVISGGAAAAYKVLAPLFEQSSGHRLSTQQGSSMGNTVAAIPMRLDRGESVDVVVMVREGLEPLIAKGQVVRGSAVNIARSRIAMAVRKGASMPDISTVEAFRRTLLQSKSVAYSDSASGVYITGELFKRLGIEAQMAGKSRMIPGTPVGEVVASGEYELGFQQYSELLPVAGIQMVGLIPAKLQKVTIYVAALTTSAKAPAAGRALIAFLASPQAYPALEASGLEPIRH
jgi:molybdate transport system substrate-binding protein